MADNLTTQSTTPATVPAGSTISTEEVTTLNGGAVSAQHVQRMAMAVRTGEGAAIDLPATAADGLQVNLGPNNDVTVSGTVAISNLPAVQPISASSMPLPTGAATDAALASLLAALLGITTPSDTQPVSGTVTIGTALPAGANNIGDVDVLSLPALPAGTNNIGDVDVLTLPSLPAGNNNIGDVDVLSLPALPAGANTIGNIGTIATSVTPGTGAANLGKAEDAAHASGDTGVAALTVRRDTAASGAGTDGDYATFNTDASGLLWTSSQGPAAHDAPAVGNPVQSGSVAETTRPAAVADGDAVRFYADELGRQVVQIGSGEDAYARREDTTNQTNVNVIAAPGAGLYIRIFSIAISTATTGTVILKEGSSVIIFGTLSLPAFGGFVWSDPKGIKFANANTGLTLTNTTGAGPLSITVNYCIEP